MLYWPYLLSSNDHPIAVQCLFFFVVFTCIKWPPFNGKKPCQIMRYFIVFKMIPRHCKEITCTKLLHADNLLLNIVNTFQMSTICYQSNSTISLDHAQWSCIKWPVPKVLRVAPVYTCVYLNVRWEKSLAELAKTHYRYHKSIVKPHILLRDLCNTCNFQLNLEVF